MKAEKDQWAQWHQDENAWWDKYGEYMTYQWKLTPYLHKVIRAPLEKEYVEYLLQPGGRLLDLGCGSGWLSLHFSDQGMSVLGIDLSREQINAANELKSRRGVMNVDFECVDFINWECQQYEGCFDSVFVSAFLHHLPEVELEMTVHKIASIVKPGGRVFMYEPLFSEQKRTILISLVDRICNVGLSVLLVRLPKWFNLISKRHKEELARGYTMISPHERPVDVKLLTQYCGNEFELVEIKGWHLHGLGYSMQVTSLVEKAKKFYEPIAVFWFWLDKILFKSFGWKAFSLPGRFILCGIKLTKK